MNLHIFQATLRQRVERAQKGRQALQREIIYGVCLNVLAVVVVL